MLVAARIRPQTTQSRTGEGLDVGGNDGRNGDCGMRT
jgi:hypothetical protein